MRITSSYQFLIGLISDLLILGLRTTNNWYPPLNEPNMVDCGNQFHEQNLFSKEELQLA